MGGKKTQPKAAADPEAKAAEALAKANSTLLKACKNDERKSAENAVKKGADVVGALDEAGNTAMHVAAMYGALGVMAFLFTSGAKLDVQNKKKRTPIQTAEKVGEENAVKLLEAFSQGKTLDLEALGSGSDDEEEDEVGERGAEPASAPEVEAPVAVAVA